MRTITPFEVLVLVLAIAGCGTDPDSRPATFQVVTQEVLMPTCGQVQCHSSTTRVEGWAFDTLDDARASLIDMNVKSNPQRNELEDVISERSMPPDSPLNDQDTALIYRWLDSGAAGL